MGVKDTERPRSLQCDDILAPPSKTDLTSVLWSVLSLSRRFLRVFLKPLDFGFSGFAAG